MNQDKRVLYYINQHKFIPSIYIIKLATISAKKLPKKIEKCHPSKKIEVQTYFPKKAAKRKAPLTYASNEHEDEIRLSLLRGTDETLNIQIGNGSDLNDHIY